MSSMQPAQQSRTFFDGQARRLHQLLQRLAACLRAGPQLFSATTRAQFHRAGQPVEIDESIGVVDQHQAIAGAIEDELSVILPVP